MPRKIHTVYGIEMIKLISRDGWRIFNCDTAKDYAEQVGMSHKYLEQALGYLKSGGYIHSLKNGLYALDIAFLGGIPIHEHEIAMFLTKPAAISHFSAFQYHGLTDQLPFVIYVSTLSTSHIPRLSRKNDFGSLINGMSYKFIKFNEAHYFGFVHRWEGSTKIVYTDLEKTLLDGLSHPVYCGGIDEVLYAFEHHIDRVDLNKIIEYALKLEMVTAKRLGWILDKIGIDSKILSPLLSVPLKGFNTLDKQSEKKGKYNSKWMIVENL